MRKLYRFGEMGDLASDVEWLARVTLLLVAFHCRAIFCKVRFDPAKPIAPRKGGKGGDQNHKGNGKGAKKGSNKE